MADNKQGFRLMNEIRKIFFPKLYEEQQRKKRMEEDPGTGILDDLLPKIRKEKQG